MKQHQILAERFHESHPDEWAGAKPRLPEARESAMRMSEEQIRSWACQYRNGEIFAEWSLIHNTDADLADRIRERWTLWYVCAFYTQEEIGMLWSWTDPEKGHIARDPFTDDPPSPSPQARRTGSSTIQQATYVAPKSRIGAAFQTSMETLRSRGTRGRSVTLRR